MILSWPLIQKNNTENDLPSHPHSKCRKCPTAKGLRQVRGAFNPTLTLHSPYTHPHELTPKSWTVNSEKYEKDRRVVV